MSILLYSPQTSPRLKYILDVVFREFLGLGVNIITQQETYISSGLPKINYSSHRISDEELFVPAHSLLFQKGICDQNPGVFYWENAAAFFRTGAKKTDFPFDVFAAVFYCLSRYEEYLPFEKDAHGRFSAKSSLAYRYQFIRVPIVDVWIRQLGEKLTSRFGNLPFKEQDFSYQPTYDVDMAWAFQHKGILRTLGATLKDISVGNFSNIDWRFSVLSGKKEDPFYTFDYLNAIHGEFPSLHPRFFLLLGDHSVYDKNISHKKTAFRKLIKQLAKQYMVGIHPSYRSNDGLNILKEEKKRLEGITDIPTKDSRQHFLRLSFPETYRRLLEAGIVNDYSMGYAKDIGFRAGTSNSFTWYDLEKEEITKLRVHPFQVMDVTLKEYLLLEPEEAIAQVKELIESIRRVNGTFTSLWHNSSFSKIEGWEEWRSVYESIFNFATLPK
ncbi:MAG: hypothetical protein GY705_05375 [Bacteroidetes bacterium]|nr:hypothetical protein [Bacteroidota bacterium]